MEVYLPVLLLQDTILSSYTHYFIPGQTCFVNFCQESVDIPPIHDMVGWVDPVLIKTRAWRTLRYLIPWYVPTQYVLA